MIEDTIAELEARIERTESVKPENKAELLRLLTSLRAEIASLPSTHREDAQSIASFTTLSAQEALREKKNPKLMQTALEGLSSSVAELEKSHPALVQAVNRICETLANLGI
jgi:hypothetical protein